MVPLLPLFVCCGEAWVAMALMRGQWASKGNEGCNGRRRQRILVHRPHIYRLLMGVGCEQHHYHHHLFLELECDSTDLRSLECRL